MRQVTGTRASGWPRPFPGWRQRWRSLSWALQRCWCEVGRGRPAAAKRLRDLAALAGLDPVIDMEVAGLEADQATWQGDLERATSAVQRGLAILDTGQFRASPTVENAWICTIGLVVQAELAERARAAGDAGTLRDAIAVGHMLLERARTAVEQQTAWTLAWRGPAGLACEG